MINVPVLLRLRLQMAPAMPRREHSDSAEQMLRQHRELTISAALPDHPMYGIASRHNPLIPPLL